MVKKIINGFIHAVTKNYTAFIPTGMIPRTEF